MMKNPNKNGTQMYFFCSILIGVGELYIICKSKMLTLISNKEEVLTAHRYTDTQHCKTGATERAGAVTLISPFSESTGTTSQITYQPYLSEFSTSMSR